VGCWSLGGCLIRWERGVVVVEGGVVGWGVGGAGERGGE